MLSLRGFSELESQSMLWHHLKGAMLTLWGDRAVLCLLRHFTDMLVMLRELALLTPMQFS